MSKFIESLSKYHQTFHENASRIDHMPDELGWMCDPQRNTFFEESEVSVYYSDKTTLIMYMWHNEKPIIKIQITVTKPDNPLKFETIILVNDLLTEVRTEETSKGRDELILVLKSKGIQIRDSGVSKDAKF